MNINAYHQPGVEAGKKAAQTVIALQGQVVEALGAQPGAAWSADEIAQQLGQPDAAEAVYHVLCHLEANARVTRQSGSGPDAAYQISELIEDRASRSRIEDRSSNGAVRPRFCILNPRSSCQEREQHAVSIEVQAVFEVLPYVGGG